MTLFEVSHLNLRLPLYEQGCILIPHLASLGYGVRTSGIVTDVYPYFVVGVLHVFSALVLTWGGIYHAVFGPEILRSGFFAYRWDDQYTMTSILGIHLVLLGLGAGLLVAKGTIFGGLYDPWSPGGGDIRRVIDPSISVAVIGSYLVSSPFGGDGWIVRVDSLEDIVGGHYVVAWGCIIGGIWHIATGPWTWAQRALTWSGEAYLSYSLAALSLMGFTAC